MTALVLGPDGRTLDTNAFALDYWGLTVEEVRADDARSRRFHPDDVARLHDERQQALLRGKPFENEQRLRRKDGQYRWFLIRYNPVRDDDGNIIRWYATGATTTGEPSSCPSTATPVEALSIPQSTL